MKQKPARNVITIYGGSGSWILEYAPDIFVSEASGRWHIRGEHLSALIRQGLIFYRGRQLITDDPAGLRAAVIKQMQDKARASLSGDVESQPEPVKRRPRKTAAAAAAAAD